MSEENRTELEIAALLHDVGKMGVPDVVLMKPGRLNGEEILLMDRHRRIGREILRGSCASQDLMDIVYYSSAWYDGRKTEFDKSGEDIPLRARMIAIVDELPVSLRVRTCVTPCCLVVT